LSDAQKSDIAREVLNLLGDARFAALFAPGSRAEVPVIGRIGNRIMPGQIDRLALVGDEVWIVDYKTNRPPPSDVADVPVAYLMQLAAYKAVLGQVYKDKAIKCFLLWTYRPLLMPVPDALLAAV
jgi:ATP-dependent helicase/nuclease subunit A